MIRFQRVGRTNDPAFRIVVTEKHTRPKSAGVETVGSFHPKTKHTILNVERIRYWLGHGAKATPRVWNLLVTEKAVDGKTVAVVKPPRISTSAPASAETAAPGETAPEAAAEPAGVEG